ncbi:MAG: von Willebrand factor type A domain-containing protein, partial [Oscillospiraceae bacterium]|nr:von Willebrand factor type A domain-containing protein [Oscillospiraceae bacterium]
MPEYEYSDSAEEYIDYIEEPAEPPVNSEEYSEFTENAFLSVKEAPLSTFSADVDTASYTNIRRLLNDGMYVPEDSVRIEEILNYFSYEYPDPNPGEPFSVTTELSACPWNADHQLMLVGIKADDMMKDDHIASNLVFLIDVSGSMSSPDKLPLVQTAFNMLADRLDENDRISIVTYAGSDSVLLDGEPGSNKNHICDVIDSLESGGSTAGAAGIITAYDIAS